MFRLERGRSIWIFRFIGFVITELWNFELEIKYYTRTWSLYTHMYTYRHRHIEITNNNSNVICLHILIGYTAKFWPEFEKIKISYNWKNHILVGLWWENGHYCSFTTGLWSDSKSDFVVGMINKPRRMANQIEDVRMSKLSRTANPQKKVHCCCGRIHVYTLNTVLQNNSRVQ